MTPNCQFWWNWWVSCAVAVATVAAVFAALYVAMRKEWFPAVLRLSIPNKEGEKTQLKDEFGTFIDDVRYYYVQISNQRRKSAPARKAQVFLVPIETPGPNGKPQTQWVGEVPIRWRNHEYVPKFRTIGTTVDCDFFRVEKKGGLRLMPVFKPNNLDVHWTEKCRFVAHLQARSNEVDSQIIQIDVSWDGSWEDGDAEMKKHVVIEEL
jgi:hypothetical protein